MLDYIWIRRGAYCFLLGLNIGNIFSEDRSPQFTLLLVAVSVGFFLGDLMGSFSAREEG